jgi:hypothetical protein
MNRIAARDSGNPGPMPQTKESTMRSTVKMIGAGAVAVVGLLAAAQFAPTQAGSKTILTTTTTQPAQQVPVLLTCPNPEPQYMEYSKGAVPYHPEMSLISLMGVVKNVGGAKFMPGAAPQAIELWIKWGNMAGQKLKSVPLPTMPGGAEQTIQVSMEPGPYLQKVNAYGLPKLTLMINTNAVGIGSAKDCKLGTANLTSIYGPNPGELQAMGINP